jgi:hypothetical protein
MNPKLRADGSGFLGSIVPRSTSVTAPFWRCPTAAQPTYAYRIHVYRATVRPMPAAAGGVAPRMRSRTGIVGLGGTDPEGRGGQARRRSDRREWNQTVAASRPWALTASSARQGRQRDCGCLVVEPHVYHRAIENKRATEVGICHAPPWSKGRVWPMPVLGNLAVRSSPSFLAQGKTPTEAYELCSYKPSRFNACHQQMCRTSKRKSAYNKLQQTSPSFRT